MELRPYQTDAVRTLWAYWRESPGGVPLIVCPTGAGKSVIIADICKRIEKQRPTYKILIVSHRKEIIEQNAGEIGRLMQMPIGVYSASAGRKDFRKITCANIQSIFRKQTLSCELLIIDEAHLFSGKDDSMYGRLLKTVSPCKVIGLTATPFRLDQGSLTGNFFTDICYDISLKQLIADGYLCNVISKPTLDKVDFSDVQKSGWDYNQGQLANKMDPLTEGHCKEIVQAAHDRKHILIFATSINHAQHVADVMNKLGVITEYITGEMVSFERDSKLNSFKAGTIRALVNCDILTTGFNFPALDCIALLRATKSTSLYVQIVGRGMRIAEGKKDCLVLDFGGNIERHGPVDCVEVKPGSTKDGSETEIGVAPTQTCKRCGCICGIRALVCPYCFLEFPIKLPEDAKPSRLPIISETKELLIQSVDYGTHNKEGKPPSMRVRYRLGNLGQANQFICFEHGGFATRRAAVWWMEAFDAESYERDNPEAEALPIPKTTYRALELAMYLRKPIKVHAIKKKFWEIIKVEYETIVPPEYSVEENPYNL